MGLVGLPPIPAITFRDVDPKPATDAGGGVGGSGGRLLGFDGLATSPFPLALLAFSLVLSFSFLTFALAFPALVNLLLQVILLHLWRSNWTGGRTGGFEL